MMMMMIMMMMIMIFYTEGNELGVMEI